MTFAQDKDSCVIYGMPKAAMDLGAVDEVVALDDIAAKLQTL
jgi:two-component system chemotaxis response regulator CheB